MLARRPAGSTPYTLLDYFPKDFLMFIDESHVTLPQVRGMSGGLSALMKLGAVRPAGKDGRRTLYERVNPQGVKQP